MDLQGPLVQSGRESWNKNMASCPPGTLDTEEGTLSFFLVCPFLRVTGLCDHHSITAAGFRKHRRLLPQAFHENPMQRSHGKHSVGESMLRSLHPWAHPHVKSLSKSLGSKDFHQSNDCGKAGFSDFSSLFESTGSCEVCLLKWSLC